MASDGEGFSAARLCEVTGVSPQTRNEWVKRKLVDRKDRYGQIDVIEQSVLKALLAGEVKKGHVPLFWQQVRVFLRRRVLSEADVLVWDPQERQATFVSTAEETRRAVVHGRSIFAVPIGEVGVRARDRYLKEMSTRRTESTDSRSRPNSEHDFASDIKP